MTDNNPKIYPIDENDPEEPTDDPIEIMGFDTGGDVGEDQLAWLLDGDTAQPSEDVDTVNMGDRQLLNLGSPPDSSAAARLADVNSLSAGDVDAIPTTDKGSAGGVASLTSSGVLPTDELPSIVITDVYIIKTESELTGLSEAEQGDVGIATDEQGSWILSDDDYSNADNWKELKTEAPPVQEVFGRTGSIQAKDGDYALEQLENVDVSALLEGTIDNRPSSGGVPTGARYHATDQDLIYRNASNGWRVIGGRGSDSSPVPEGHYESLSTENTHTERIAAGGHHYAGDYPGVDSDARLSNAISEASDGDVIYLELAGYSDDRTINKPVAFIGQAARGSTNGTYITGEWTLESEMTFERVALRNNVNINQRNIRWDGGIWGGDGHATVAVDRTVFIGNYFADITFENGTSGGIAVGNASSTITDNGNNEVFANS